MTSPVLLRALALPAVLALTLTGCTTTGGDSGDSGDSGRTGTGVSQGGGSDEGGTDDGGAAAGGCASLDTSSEPKLALGVTDFVSAGPAEGQPYGDGTTFSVTLSEKGIASGYLPQFELYGQDESGAFVLLSSNIFDPDTGADGTYSTSNSEFGNDDYVGKAVIADVFAIDPAISGSGGLGSENYVVLASYCVTYAH